MHTFHAIVWLDHCEAHVVMFDHEHVEAQRITSRSHHKHEGQADDNGAFFTDIANALRGTREILLSGPGLARNHQTALADGIVDSVASDHPTDGQLVALARQYFKKFDNMAADPSML
jgi:hypothetical protein